VGRVEGDKINVGQQTLKEIGQLVSLLIAVVDTVHQRIFNTDTSPGGRDIVSAGPHQLGERIAPIDGYQLVTQIVGRGV
jgi:hypothetical protein